MISRQRRRKTLATEPLSRDALLSAIYLVYAPGAGAHPALPPHLQEGSVEKAIAIKHMRTEEALDG